MEKQSPTSVPWYIWCAVLAVTSAMIGFHWDISWHRSIGRDTFWTPAHIAIYMCGVLAGISCGYLILATTFGPGFQKDASVKIWGFRGPIGAFIAAWGGVAMLTSAPFDDWWHNAYGLDVKILSPPHVLLGTGVLGIEFGALILILGYMNRAEGRLRQKLEVLFLYIGAMILVCLLILGMEYTFRSYMHSAKFYRVVALTAPLVLAGVSRASRRRWASTTVIAIYTAFLLGLEWILPLFPAEPKLAPVYIRVTHLIPAGFPLLLIFPAFVLDLLWAKLSDKNKWIQAVLAGCGFLLIFIFVQWPFANFLMTPASRNWFFGTHYFDYNSRPTSYYVRNLFFALEQTSREFWVGIALAFLASVLMTRLGLAWGAWMQRIRR